MDVRNLLPSAVTLRWQEESKSKEIDLLPGSKEFISIVMVKTFYPDPIKLKAFDRNTKEMIKLRGREELEIMLHKKAYTERIDIGKMEYFYRFVISGRLTYSIS